MNNGEYCGMPPLLTAVERDREACMNLLLESGADVNKRDEDGRTALIHGAQKGYRYVRTLLAAGADVNVVCDGSNFSVRTALIEAVAFKGTRKVRLLLNAGARINVRDQLGRNCLEYSITLDMLKKEQMKDAQILLAAAGESIDGATVIKRFCDDSTEYVKIPEYLKELKVGLDLKHLCRRQ